MDAYFVFYLNDTHSSYKIAKFYVSKSVELGKVILDGLEDLFIGYYVACVFSADSGSMYDCWGVKLTLDTDKEVYNAFKLVLEYYIPMDKI